MNPTGPKPFAGSMDKSGGIATKNSGYKVPKYTQATVEAMRGRAASSGPMPYRGGQGTGVATPKKGG